MCGLDSIESYINSHGFWIHLDRYQSRFLDITSASGPSDQTPAVSPHLQVVHKQNHVALGGKGQGEFVLGRPAGILTPRYGKLHGFPRKTICKAAKDGCCVVFLVDCQFATGELGFNHQDYIL